MDSHDLAWIAGFLEGEGMFTYHVSKRGYCKIRIGASQTDADVLERLTSLVPGSHMYGPRKPHAGSLAKKPVYVWVLQIKPLAVELATQLRPLMGKRRQGQIDEMLTCAASHPVIRNRKVPAEHGTALTYRRGCRCQPCRDADSAYQREGRIRRKALRDAQGA